LHESIVSGEARANADKYPVGRPRRRETAADVEQMQRVLMLVRSCYYAEQRMTLSAVAEFIRAWFEATPLKPPIPPIDYDQAQLTRVRSNSRSILRDRLHREPTAVELAIEVAAAYRQGEPAVEAALRKMRRLIREAERYEYVFSAELTGKLALPTPRARR
jgi:hypothetical protein